MKRHEALKEILNNIDDRSIVLTTTGMISREAFYQRDRGLNFYMLGSMGLLSSFGLGLAILYPERKIFVIDGDGSFFMGLATIPLITYQSPSNYFYVILDNMCYESTGGQPSISEKIKIYNLLVASGFTKVYTIETRPELDKTFKNSLKKDEGPVAFHVIVDRGRLEGVPRVSISPEKLKIRLKENLRKD